MRLRIKLAAAIAGVSALAATGLGYWVHTATDQARLNDARQLIDQRLQHAVTTYLDNGTIVLSATIDDAELPPPVLDAAKAGQRATYLAETGEGPVLWAATTVRGKVLSVRASYAAERQAQRELDRILLVSGAGTVAGASLLGVLLARGMSRRLGAAARAARRIAGGELDTRVQDAIGRRGRDEVTELGAAVDAMSAALRDRLEAERRVTADIAHELRTPITGLVTAAELLPPGRPTELVRDRVGVLRGLIEDVLEVARLDARAEPAEPREIATSELARRAVEPAGDRPVAVHVERDAVVCTDPRRVQRILTNLLANAHNHGAPPVQLRVDGSRIEVRDHGPGFPAELLEHGPQRFRTGSRERGGGHGLGLTIATGQAGVIGAQLSFANAADGGGRAILDLTEAPA